jgi:diguanylate cyclase (GGDEF)-like protein/PAS domain S-box-containing protein
VGFHFIRFLDAATDARQTLPTEYDAALVVLSYLTAAVASSAALLIAWRVRSRLGDRAKALWLSLGAVTMGMGVWAMHFVAMLAMSLPLPIAYDVPITVLSIVPAIVAGGVCLTGAHRGTTGWLVGGGVIMGLGIGAMHYIGMAAMRVNAEMLYDPWLFLLSIAVAALLAIASLQTVRWSIGQTVVKPVTALLLSGAIMGLAVTAMHYTGMAALHFLPLAGDPAAIQTGLDAVHLAIVVVAAILAIVALAIAGVLMDHRIDQLRSTARSEAEKFAHLLETVPDGVIVITAEGEIRLVNSRVESLFRYPRDALLRHPIGMLMADRLDETGVHRSLRSVAAADQPTPGARFKLRGKRADHSEFPAEISVNRITTPEGPLVICAIRDVTEQEEAREALREANERLTAGMKNLESQSEELRALTEMGELLLGCEEEQEAFEVISNMVGQLLPDTPGAVYILSRSRNILQSMAAWGQCADPLVPVFNPEDCWALRRGRMYTARSRQPTIQCRHAGRVHDGYVCIPMLAHGEVLGVLHVVATANAPAPANGAGESALERKRILLIAIAEKIGTAIANLRLREELRNQSIRDPLTGLLNRRFMEEALEREVVRATRMATTVSVVAVDLDHFKRFNDTFGHEGGDLVLREVGAVLSRVAQGDNLACRLGGEELLLILPDIALEEAMALSEKLRRKIEKLSVVHRGQQLGKITASFGVAEYPRHGDSQREVLRAADRALYGAKSAGRNCVVAAERVDDTSVSIRAIDPGHEATTIGNAD